jgi:hypothetical protein
LQPAAAQVESPAGPDPLVRGAAAAIYVAVGGERKGPFDASALAAEIAAGRLTLDTLIWAPGMRDWTPIRDMPAVAALFAPSGAPAVDPQVEADALPAGTDEPVATSESERWQAFVKGTWKTRTVDQATGAQITFIATYSERGFVALAFSSQQEGMGFFGGAWTVEPTGPTTFTLTMKLDPELSPSAQGSELVYEATAIDEDTLHFSDGSISERQPSP